MKSCMFLRFSARAACIGLFACSLASAQLSVEKVTATNRILQQMKGTINKLPSSHQQMLDGYANISNLADVWRIYGMRLTDPSFIAHAKNASGAPEKSEIVRVSDPATDLAYSSFAGFTQSETSAARCGENVVIGYNDSGSVFETPFFFTGSGGEGFSGASYSADGGETFKDIGPINPGPNQYNFLGGDPVVNCANPHTFYYSQIFTYDTPSGNPRAAVALSTSTDGGMTWADPVAAVSKDGNFHLLDKPWSTIDPSNHQHIFVSYTDFDYTETNSCGSNFPLRTAIEFVESTDGGGTWSHPKVVIAVCGSAGVQGSQMAVSSKGTMYMSWMNLGENFPLGPRSIQISSYANGVLSRPVTVDNSVQPGGDSYYLQGEFRDVLDMSMAIDHSGTSSDGTLYITWGDGRDKEVSDPVAIQGFYAFDDVFLRLSVDGGKTWGAAPRKVNSDAQPRLGIGHDHYQPGIAVDKRGYVGICWYDRRADWENFGIRRHCGQSRNSGATFSDNDIGMNAFAPTHGNDVFVNPIYMGDYDQMTSDFMNWAGGFIGGFETQTVRGNPDVLAYPLK